VANSENCRERLAGGDVATAAIAAHCHHVEAMSAILLVRHNELRREVCRPPDMPARSGASVRVPHQCVNKSSIAATTHVVANDA
jgi:hypothetical protein